MSRSTSDLAALVFSSSQCIVGNHPEADRLRAGVFSTGSVAALFYSLGSELNLRALLPFGLTRPFG